MSAPFVPALPPLAFGELLAPLMPAERELLRYIIDGADLLQVEDAPDHLLVPVDGRMLDLLAAFEASLDDREPDMDDEIGDPGEDDDPPEDEGDFEIGDDHDLAALGRLQEARYRQDVKGMLGLDLGPTGAIAVRPGAYQMEPDAVEKVPR